MKVYSRHPFDTSSSVLISKDCGPDHPGSKDLVFNGIDWGTYLLRPRFIGDRPQYRYIPGKPVYAMEEGTVADIRNSSPHCTDPNHCPLYANMVLVQGRDEFYTEYAHVRPSTTLQRGMFIPSGQFLGTVDFSGVSTGPNLHVGRYARGDAATWYNRPICDWSIEGVRPIRRLGRIRP